MRSAPVRLFLVCFIFLVTPLFGAERNRNTIGLALEGGGAHGLAHIGVLKWMEEHRIPVDYVAGTSMGGLIGGAYATGMRPQEIEQILTQVNWPQTLRGELPFKALSFRRKEDLRELPTSLEFGLKKGIRLPSGFNAGQEIGFILDRIALPYSSIQSFAELPIPFRCVAVELVSGQQEVFNQGSLAVALRSTMSIPGYFTPVRTSDKIYVDGGLLNNLPVNVVRDMGAGIVIAIHLDQARLDSKTSLSSLAVLSWSIEAVTSSNERRSLEQADIGISVPLRDISWEKYTAFEEIIRRGYQAAEKSAAQLLPLALNEQEWAQHLAGQQERSRLAPAKVDFIEVTGVGPHYQELIGRELQEFAGKPLDQAGLQEKLTELRGTKRFHTLDYQVVTRNESTGLRIIAREPGYQPPILNMVFNIDGSTYNNPQFSIGARVTFMNAKRPGDEVRIDVAAGSRYLLAGEYYKPLAVGKRWFIAPRAGFDSATFPIYLQAEHIADYRIRQFFGGIDFGYAINRFSEFRIGYEGGNLKFSRDVGSPTLPELDGRRGLTRLRYAFISLDDPIVPLGGQAVDFNAGWFDSNPGTLRPFPSSELQYLHFTKLRDVNSVFLIASGGSTFGKNDEGLPVFSLGGPLRLSAYATNELLTNQYFLFRAGYIRQIKGSDSLLGVRSYFFGAYEIGRAYGVVGQSRLPNDLAVGMIAKTFFGPFLIGGAYGDNGHRKIFFRLGRLF